MEMVMGLNGERVLMMQAWPTACCAWQMEPISRARQTMLRQLHFFQLGTTANVLNALVCITTSFVVTVANCVADF
jgi:hypothetical protein